MSTKRRPFAVPASVSRAILLSSCVAGAQRGQTLDRASAAAAAVRGVTNATVEMRNHRSGFTSEWGTTVNFTPSPDFAENNADAALRGQHVGARRVELEQGVDHPDPGTRIHERDDHRCGDGCDRRDGVVLAREQRARERRRYRGARLLRLVVGKLLQRSGRVEEGAVIPGRTSAIVLASLLRERLGE